MSKIRRAAAFVVAGLFYFGTSNVLAQTGGLLSVGPKLPEEVVGTKYEEACETLKALGIMVGDEFTGDFRINDDIKRSEFAKIAVVAMGLENIAVASSQTPSFPDVPQGHWAVGFINTASGQNIVIGDEDGNFRPDDKITYAESMTMLVRMLGYDPAAQAKGGFPSGYLVVGSENQLNKNITASTSAAISRGNVAQMTYNALTVRMMEQTGFGTDKTHAVSEKTLLKDRLNTSKITGLFIADDQTAIEGGPMSEGFIKIDDNVLRCSMSARALLGATVNAYARLNDFDEEEVILITADKNRNRIVKILAEDVDEASNDEVYYWVDKETDREPTRLIISEDAKFLRNGNQVDTISAPQSGSMTLIDNNQSGMYSVVSINEHVNYVVEDVSTVSNTISDKYSQGSLVLDPADKSVKFALHDVDGNNVDISDLKEWDVLSVVKNSPSNATLIDATLVNKRVEGTVNEIMDEEYSIEGVMYKKADNYPNIIQLGDQGLFYLDVDNKIAAIDTSASISANYAYLNNAAMKAGINNRAEFEILNKNGEVVILSGAERMKLNTASGLSGAEVVATLAPTELVNPTMDDISKRLITYELNSTGEVREITTATNMGGSTVFVSGQFVLNTVLNDAVYRATSRKLDGITLTDRTIVFDIPEGTTDIADYSVRDYKMFANDNKYDVAIYDIQEDVSARVVVVTSSTTDVVAEKPIAVVDRITTTTNLSGTRVEKLYALENGERIELIAAETYSFTTDTDRSLAQGDIIQYRLNARGEVDNTTLLFDITTREFEITATPAPDLRTVYGSVERRFANSINVKVGSAPVESFSTAGATVYKVDLTKVSNQVTVATTGDIERTEEANNVRVFMRLYKDEVKEIAIIKFP